jgi:glycosyltransferase involved in cell wall biosynthesis
LRTRSPEGQKLKTIVVFAGDMTKVLYFLNSTVRGGVEEHVLGLLNGLDRSRFEPVLVCPRELLNVLMDKAALRARDVPPSDANAAGPEAAFIKIPDDVKTYPVKIRRWTDRGDIQEFRAVLKAVRPDIVHTHLFFATLFAAPLAKGLQVPAVVETAHIREAWRRGLKACYWLDRYYYRSVDRIIAVSHAVKQYLVTVKKLKPEKITVIHNGVDLSRFSPNTLEVPVHGAPVRFAVIGRLEEQKGHTYFLSAIGMMEKEVRSRAEFLVVGEGQLRGPLMSQAKALGIESEVRFFGFRRDIANIITGCDCVVLPSLFEGLPLVLLEAGALNKAVIATAVDRSPEVIEEGRTACVVPARAPLPLKAAMEKFINDRNLLVEFGRNAHKRVEACFNIKNQIKNTENFYKTLLTD